MVVLLAAGHVLAAGDLSAAPIQFKAVVLEKLEKGVNLAPDGNFETLAADGIPSGWRWDRRNTDATCTVDRHVTHRGRCAMKFTSTTPFGAHVYGMFWRTQPIALQAGRTYTMSVWVRSDSPGIVSLVGGSSWQFRTSVPATKGQWRRIAKTFAADENERQFTLRMNVEAPTPGVWFDDLRLEEGATATLAADDVGVHRIALDVDEAEITVQGDGPFRLPFLVSTDRTVAGTAVVALNSGESWRHPLQLAPGAWRLVVAGEAAAVDNAPRTLTLQIEESKSPVAQAETVVCFYSPQNATQRAEQLRKALPGLQRDLAAVKAHGQDVSYPQITMTVLENFVAYAAEDVKRGEVRRAFEQLDDMRQMAAGLRSDLDAALAGKRTFPLAPRWTGEKRPHIVGSAFVAPVRWPDGKQTERPVFFTGYGHFGQVAADMEKWPAYGTNIIQIEFGPNSIFPSENQTDAGPVCRMQQILDRAQKSGVAVCLLISPHYFPHWALEKWPALKKRNSGFLKYCLHASEGQELLKRYIAAAIAPLKDHPALHSICISNEPILREEPCAPAAKLWRGWLEQRHKTIAQLNAAYGTHHQSFADVPLPNPYEAQPAMPVWMDYIRFNQDFLADWHKMLADAVHAAAPNVPVHSKAMNWTMLSGPDVKYGVDATLFARFSDINGNDAANTYCFGNSEFAQHWLMNAMGHDLQRSVLDAPVFNSENHLITDRDIRYVPASHIRAAIWQAAAHGQSATTVWVWERCYAPKADMYASIMHRPACAAAVGVVNCDLNRAAEEMTALQKAAPDVLLLHSHTALVWDGTRYEECRNKLYTALTFMGLKTGFVTERQLEAGHVPAARVLFVPAVSHFSTAALAQLKKFPGRLVFLGDNPLGHDEYGRTRKPDLPGETLPWKHGVSSAQDLLKTLTGKLPAWKVRPAASVSIVNEPNAWGVEWRCAETPQGVVVNLCNYRQTPVTLTVARTAQTGAAATQATPARDVLTGESVRGPFTLAPLEVRLLRLEQ